MSLPTQIDAFYLTLKMFDDGRQHTRKDIFDKAITEFSLNDDDIRSKAKGGTPIYMSRLGWGISYLAKAGMLKKISGALYQITPRGEEELGKDIRGMSFLDNLNSIIYAENPWNVGSGYKQSFNDEARNDSSSHDERSPQEAIEQAVSSLNDSLASELLNMILDHDPYVFEEIVVKLLEVMEYGVGEVTSKSNDGGIDGIITTDPLGFESIYTQAKRYNPNNKVGAPEIQGFIGALRNANKGVFITTSSFQPAAIDTANSCLYARVRLIDGEELINLMIKYNVGVTLEDIYEVKRIDLDFFDELS